MQRRKFIALGAIVTSGCTSNLSGSSDADADQSTSNPRVTVVETSYGFDGLTGGLRIFVTIESELEESLEILVADKKGNTLGSSVITKNSILDGRDTAEIDLPDASPGSQLRIQVVSPAYDSTDSEIVGEESVSIPQPKFTLDQPEILLKERTGREGFWVSEVSVRIRNTGEIPITVTSAYLTISGTETDLSGVGPIDQTIQPESSNRLKQQFYTEDLVITDPPAEGIILVETKRGNSESTTTQTTR